MERKDYLLIVILIIVAVFLGCAIMMKHVRVIVAPQEVPRADYMSARFFLPRADATEDLALGDVMTGIMVLGGVKGLELTSKQKSDIQAVLNDIKPKQAEYEKVLKDIDDSIKKLNRILSSKQRKYIAQNRGELGSKMREGGEIDSSIPGQDIVESLEKSLSETK